MIEMEQNREGKKMKYKWKVSEAPSGPYRSFQKRSWPFAYYCDKEESPACAVYCDTSYSVTRMKDADHAPLTMMVADHSVLPVWQWKKVKGEFKTLQEAKDRFVELLKKFPQLCPVEKK
jgi:hypothetical protein